MPFLTEAQVLTVEANVGSLAEAVARDKAATAQNVDATRRSAALAIEAKKAVEEAAGGVATNTEAAETAAAAAEQALADIDIATTGAAEGGAWVIDTAYDAGDWVVYRNNGYVARQDNTGERPSETGNTAYWRLMVRGSNSDEIWLSAYDPDPTGVVGFAAIMETAAEDADELGRTLRVGAGTYLQERDIDINGYSKLKIAFDPGVIIRNPGRQVLKNDGETLFYQPWSFFFTDCPDLKVLGFPTFKCENTTNETSSGCFNSTSYTRRRPVIGLIDCPRYHVQVKHQGNPGPGISGADRDAIITALSLTPTPEEYAYFALRGAFFNAYRCDDGVHEGILVPDSTRREQFTFLQSHRNKSIRPTSISDGNNFASLGKSIRCNSFQIFDPQVKDTGSGSLWDIIGDDFLMEGGTLIEYPNGKVLDLSHEWAAACGPVRRPQIRGMRSTGRGIVNVGGATTEQVEAAPISDLLVQACRFNIGRTSFSADASANIPRIITAKYRDMAFVNESPVGYTFLNDGGELIEIVDSSMTWTLPSASLDTNNRILKAAGLVKYVNCEITANASLSTGTEEVPAAGLALLSFDGSNVGGKHYLYGGAIKDTNINVSQGAEMRLFGVDLTDVTWVIASGSIAFVGCTRDGVPMDDLVAETRTVEAAYSTAGFRKALDELDTFIRELKEMGAWPLIERVSVTVADAEDQAYIDLIDPVENTLAPSGAVTFTVNGGLAGNGSSSNVATDFNPSTATKFLQDSAYWGIWTGGDGSSYPNSLIGASTGSFNSLLITRDGSNQAVFRINDASSLVVAGITDSRGWWSAWRTGATTRAVGHNGVVVGTDGEVSTERANDTLRIGRRGSSYSGQPWFLYMVGAGGLGALDARIHAAARRLLVARGAVT